MAVVVNIAVGLTGFELVAVAIVVVAFLRVESCTIDMTHLACQQQCVYMSCLGF